MGGGDVEEGELVGALGVVQGGELDGVEGAIVGTALYEGRFTLTEALELTRP